MKEREFLDNRRNKIINNFDFNKIGKIKFRHKGKMINTPFDSLSGQTDHYLFTEWKKRMNIE